MKRSRFSEEQMALGGIPVTIPFGETQHALERGVTDCAITTTPEACAHDNLRLKIRFVACGAKPVQHLSQ